MRYNRNNWFYLRDTVLYFIVALFLIVVNPFWNQQNLLIRDHGLKTFFSRYDCIIRTCISCMRNYILFTCKYLISCTNKGRLLWSRLHPSKKTGRGAGTFCDWRYLTVSTWQKFSNNFSRIDICRPHLVSAPSFHT